jgi:hypothetical protein
MLAPKAASAWKYSIKGRSRTGVAPHTAAAAVLYRQRGMLPTLRCMESTAALKGVGSGDHAGVRGPACDGRGHVDRLIT